jgi:predicted nuclease with TOPRIM domain
MSDILYKINKTFENLRTDMDETMQDVEELSNRINEFEKRNSVVIDHLKENSVVIDHLKESREISQMFTTVRIKITTAVGGKWAKEYRTVSNLWKSYIYKIGYSDTEPSYLLTDDEKERLEQFILDNFGNSKKCEWYLEQLKFLSHGLNRCLTANLNVDIIDQYDEYIGDELFEGVKKILLSK